MQISKLCEQKSEISTIISNVATGGHAPPPTVDRHGHRILANPRFFSGWGGD